jgi:acyl phosphate:glycerol-3-phosphate acyltransferase
MMITGKELSWVIGCYLLGCFTAGYYYVRWRTGLDIRRHGSGNVGARNVGRLLGKSGFCMTLLLDFAKGLLAVGAARTFEMDPYVVTAALFAVVIGHNWPLQLRFQGGKGIAVSLGALTAYDPFILLILVVLFPPVWAVLRNFTLSGLLAYSCAPLAVFWCGLGPLPTFAVSITAILIVVAHRKNIREEIAKLSSNRPPKQATNQPPERRGAP